MRNMQETIAVSKRTDGQLAIITRPPGLRVFIVSPESFTAAFQQLCKKTGLIAPIAPYGIGNLTLPESSRLGMTELRASHTHIQQFLKILKPYEVE